MSAEQQTPAQSEAAQQIPITLQLQEVPAADTARESLLRAIGREADSVSVKNAGGASTALLELARAYALVVSPSAPALTPGVQTRAGGHQVGLCLELEP
jgi:hypothetical protein